MLPLALKSNNSGGTRPTIEISVAGGPKIPVLFDTGSQGLRVFDNSVGTAGISETATRNEVTFGSGNKFIGNRATAPAIIAGKATAGPISIQLVHQVVCIETHPNCAGRHGFSSYIAKQGVRGILGAGLGSGDVFSPLLQLQGGYPKSYTIALRGSASNVTLNAPITSPAGSFPIPQADNPSHANGSPAWSDQRIPGCWAYNSAARSCVSTVFDTGATHTSTDTSVPGTSTASVPSDTVLSLATSATDKPIWRISSATGVIEIRDHVSAAAVNTGISLFKTFDVTFNVANGMVVLTTAPRH